MKYAEKLKDPRWQKRRLEILSRDDWKCVHCLRKDRTLHVHHRSYHGEPWDAPDEELVTVCEDCHEGLEFYRHHFDGKTEDPIRESTKARCLLRASVILRYYDIPITLESVLGVVAGCVEWEMSIQRCMRCDCCGEYYELSCAKCEQTEDCEDGKESNAPAIT